jgi:hypothetical protein
MIGIHDLTPDDAKKFGRIYLNGNDGCSAKVPTNYMPPFVARHVDVPVTKTLDVGVDVCDDATMRLAMDKLGIK